MDPVAALASLGGAARRAQLLRLGLSDPELRRAASRGAVTRPHRGCYALPDAHPRVVRARILSAQLTCVSGAIHMGLPVLGRHSGLHLALPANRGLVLEDRRLRDDVVLHRFGGPRTRAGDGAVLETARFLDHLGRCVSPSVQLVAVDAALNRLMIRPSDIWAFTATGRRRRAWLAAVADGRAQAPGETLARMELRTAGFAVTPQAFIDGVGHVDLLVEGRVVVEVDGFTYHRDRAAFEEDERRDRALTLLRIPHLRYPFTFVRGSRGRIAREVAALLSRTSARRAA